MRLARVFSAIVCSSRSAVSGAGSLGLRLPREGCRLRHGAHTLSRWKTRPFHGPLLWGFASP